MRVILGLYFDGGAVPSIPQLEGKPVCAGVLALGPAGFLSLLESRLGLPPAEPCGALRIACWHKAMRTAPADAFYASSYTADSWGTAKRVLAMRDNIRLAGWTGADIGGGQRLQELARLEALTNLADSLPGFGDRFQRVLHFLPRRRCGIREVELVEDKGCWQPVWQKLFSLLQSQHTFVHPAEAEAAPAGGTAIAHIAAALQKHTRIDCAALPQDDSFRILRATTQVEAMEAVTVLGIQEPPSVVLRTPDNVLLDATFMKYGLPAAGSHRLSSGRAAVQLLPMFLRLQLLPFDPALMHQFLLLPFSPISKEAACLLAHALEREAGRGDRWEKALGIIAGDESLAAALEFLPPVRIPSECTAEHVMSLAEKLGRWAAAQGYASSLAAGLARLCVDFVNTIRHSGLGTISEVLLEQLCAETIGSGMSLHISTKEAAPWLTIAQPGQLWRRTKRLFWVDFSARNSSTELQFWTGEERAALTRAQVHLPCAKNAMLAEAEAWTRPLRYADQVVLVLPQTDGRDAVVPHPVYTVLTALMGERVLQEEPFVMWAEDILSGTAKYMSGAAMTETAPVRSLPQARHCWDIPAQTAPTLMSVSRLESALRCPFAWFAEERLRLQGQPPVLGLSAVQLGTLAHRIMECALRDAAFMQMVHAAEGSSRQHLLQERVSALCEQQAPRCAAVLMLPAHLSLLEYVKQTLTSSLSVLLSFMQRQMLLFSAAEKEVSIQPEGVETLFKGRLDLELRDAADTPVLLDMKWTKSIAKYREKLRGQHAPQLAAYAAMLPKTRDAGYFLLQNGNILMASENDSASDALVTQWEEILAQWDALVKEWQAGCLKASGNAGDEESGKICGYCDYAWLCGRAYVC